MSEFHPNGGIGSLLQRNEVAVSGDAEIPLEDLLDI